MNSFSRLVLISFVGFCFGHISQATPLFDQNKRVIKKYSSLSYNADTLLINTRIRRAIKLVRAKPDSAIELMYKNLQSSIPEKYYLGIGNSYLYLATAFFYKFQYDSALNNYLKAFDVFKTSNEIKGMAKTQSGLSYVYSARSEMTKSLQCMLVSKKYFEELKDFSGIYDCIIGLIFINNRLNNKKAVDEYMNELISAAEKLNDKKKLANSYIQLGNYYIDQTYLKLAIEAYFKALKLAEESNDSDEIGNALGNIGLANLYLHEYNDAITYYLKQEQILLKLNDEFELSNTYSDMGQAFNGLNKFSKGLEYHLKSFAIRKKMNYKPGISNSLYNIGLTYYLKEEADSALKYTSIAFKLNKEINNQMGIALNYMLSGKINHLKKDDKQAIRLLEQSMKIAEEYNYQDVILEASGSLSRIYAQLKSYENAYRNILVHYEISDSMINRENLKSITQLEMQHEFDKKQNEVEFNHLQKTLKYETQIKRNKIVRNFSMLVGLIISVSSIFVYFSYQKSRKANKEKEALLKEIHHRVKNNLQVISSLLNLQSGSIEDSNTKKAVKESQSRVKSMALIHQLLYQSEMFSKIDFGEYLEQLMSSLQSAYKKPGRNIKYVLNTQKIKLDIDVAIPLGLITNELATNAYKYAFNDSTDGTISINFSSNSTNDYLLCLSDNGPGMPKDFDPEKSNTLGLKLVKLLTKQIGGHVNFDNTHGTSVYIRFHENVKTQK